MKTCTFEGCERPLTSALLCDGHYQQKRKGKELTPLRTTHRSDIRNEEGYKLCIDCKIWQPEVNFWKDNKASGMNTRDGLVSICKTCERSRMLKRNFNITIDQYNELLTKQGGVCAICGEVPTVSLAVDHDHKCCPNKKKSCGKCVRGLLCGNCNGAIGMLKEDKEIFMKALQYLGGDAK